MKKLALLCLFLTACNNSQCGLLGCPPYESLKYTERLHIQLLDKKNEIIDLNSKNIGAIQLIEASIKPLVLIKDTIDNNLSINLPNTISRLDETTSLSLNINNKEELIYINYETENTDGSCNFCPNYFISEIYNNTNGTLYDYKKEIDHTTLKTINITLKSDLE